MKLPAYHYNTLQLERNACAEEAQEEEGGVWKVRDTILLLSQVGKSRACVRVCSYECFVEPNEPTRVE